MSRFLKFAAVSVCIFIITTAVYWVSVDIMGHKAWITTVVYVPFMFISKYIIFDKVVFKNDR